MARANYRRSTRRNVQRHNAVPTEQKAATNFGMESLFLTGREVPLDGSGQPITGANISRAYENSWIAYSCIRRIATDAKGIPLQFLSDPNDPESAVSESHPIRKLFSNPNDFFSTREFIDWIMVMINLRGEFFVTFDNPMRPTEMIQYMDPLSWREKVSGGRLQAWEFRQGGMQGNWADDEIMHHRLIRPSNPWRGQAPLQAAQNAHTIENGSSDLQVDILGRGGERAVLYSAEKDMNRTQRDMALEQLRARRQGANRIANDVLLPNQIKVIDPRFIEDDMEILKAQQMQPDKIASVFGLSLSLLGHEDIDKFATFTGRVKQYFHQTLIPQLRGVEDTFDSYFVTKMPSAWQCYVRFAFDQVPALQDDLNEKFKTAGQAHKDGLPWTVLNERFKLGIDTDEVPGADRIMVSSTLAPLDALLAEWESGSGPVEPSPDPDEGKALTGPAAASQPLTQKMVIERATDPRSAIRRAKRLRKIEKEYRTEYKSLVQATSRKVQAAVAKAADDPARAKAAVAAEQKRFTKASLKMAEKYHGEAAVNGQISIVELIDKIDDQGMDILHKAAKFRPEVKDWIKLRQNLVEGMADDLFADVTEAVVQVVTEDFQEIAQVTDVIRSRFLSAPGGINRAITIARTEVGSAYNVARNVEMSEQGFEKHQWLTAGDELVRDGESGFDHVQCNNEIRALGEPFSCDLTYPMEDGGEAGNVINCRCETIPIVGRTN